VAVEQHNIEVAGLPTRYLTAGTGPPLVLLHGAGDNALDWRWVLPALARTHHVYAPDLPGSPDSARPAADYSPAFFERFVAGFLDALGLDRAVMVGNSLGGLVALRLALSEPARIGTLVLVDAAGLGRAVNPVFTFVNVPGLAEAATPLWRTPAGAYQRAWGREGGTALRAPRKHPARVVGGAVQAGAVTRLPGSPRNRAPRSSVPGGPTRGAGGPAPFPKNPNASRLGGARPGVPGVPGKGRDLSSPGRFTRPDPRLRPHAPRRVPRSLLDSLR
jgi:pimeloyl-ACP methyl ester carboxylesterase